VRQLLENVQRQQLNDLDQARALHQLLEETRAAMPSASDGTRQEHVGHLVGLSQASVQRYLGLLDLAEGVQAMLADGSLTVTQAQHLRAVKDQHRQEDVAAFAVREHLSAAQVSKLCSVLQRQPHMRPEAALELAQSRQAVPTAPAAVAPAEPARLPSRPSREEDAGGLDTYFTKEEQGSDFADEQSTPSGKASSETRDGNRVLRIRSVASFCDEVDRLARCVQDGDLVKLAKSDKQAAVKLRLALKQLRFTQQALQQLAAQEGWGE
jgi:ParB family chromosome partitioning protein